MSREKKRTPISISMPIDTHKRIVKLVSREAEYANVSHFYQIAVEKYLESIKK